MPNLSRVIGWSPPNNQAFVDVPVSHGAQLFPRRNATHQLSGPSLRRSRRTLVDIFEDESASSTDDHSSDEKQCPAGKRVGHTGTRADPAWVARPKNEFILFRCDYVRKHAHQGKRVRRVPGAEGEKTLSKQAAEAWHHLPPDERLYWKERANGERKEHARRYPDYRYRPKKSATGRRRQARCSPTKVLVPIDRSSSATVASENPQQPDLSPLMSRRSSTETSAKSSPPLLELDIPECTNQRVRPTQDWTDVPNATPDSDSGGLPREFSPMSTLDSISSFEPSENLSSDFISKSYPDTSFHNGSSSSSSSNLQSTMTSVFDWTGALTAAASPQPTEIFSSTSILPASLSGLELHLHDVNDRLLLDYAIGGCPESVSAAMAHQHQPPFSAHSQPDDIWMAQIYQPVSELSQPHVDLALIRDSSGAKMSAGPGQDHGVHSSIDYPNGAVYDSDGRAIHMDDVYLSGSVDYASPTTLFTMDIDEFFDPIC